LGAHRGLRHRDSGPRLLAQNEYRATENRILKDQLKGRLMLSDAERATLGEIGHRPGRKVLAELATVAAGHGPGWYRKLVARKFSSWRARQGPGRPQLKREVEQLIIRMASEARIPVCNAARDRNNPVTAYQINLRRSPIAVIINRFAGDRQPFCVYGRDNRTSQKSVVTC
jgi:hypothetical protein